MKDATEALDRLRWHERRLYDAPIHFEGAQELGAMTKVSGADVQSLDPDVILIRMPGGPLKVPYDKVSRIDLADGLYWLPQHAEAAGRGAGPMRS